MAHYAFLDGNNIVTEVIVGKDEGEDGIDWEAHYGNFRGQTCKRTSYNTQNGQHPNGTPLRKNYAGIGYSYDPMRDAFIPPQPFPSWVLNESTCLWESPIPYPENIDENNAPKLHIWDEQSVTWRLIDGQV
jgi:hypothetical protein